MAKLDTKVATQLTTQRKIALGFIVGTAIMVVVSVVLASIGTLVANRQAATRTPTASSDRTFVTQ